MRIEERCCRGREWESWEDKGCWVCVCVCLHILDRYMDREISLPQQVCPLALFHSIWGYRINLGKHVSLSLCLPFSHPLHSLPPDEDSVCSQLLCHMSQLRQKCLLGFFSQYFSPVTRFAPGRCTNPIKRKPMAPPGQIKALPLPLLSHSLSHSHKHTVLSAAPADLSEPYKDNSCSLSTYTDMNNDNSGLPKTIINKRLDDKNTHCDLPGKNKEGN